MPRDANAVLAKEGADALRERVDRAIKHSADEEANGAAKSSDRGKSKKTKKQASDNDDAGLTDAFVEEHGEGIRYVSAWGKWFAYDGTVWKEERTQLVRDLCKRFCQNRGSGRAKTIAAVQTLASATRIIAAKTDQWDADPWRLNTSGGVVDLRSGEMSPHDAADHMTKVTEIAPGGECPLWLDFLARIFDGNYPLIAYVQRVAGYSLTGSTKEHAMFFGYGSGGNGKSVLLDTIAGVMGDYHTAAPIETFTASSTDRHPTELARLVGARLVTAIETEEGRRWAETRIKTLTGGDRVAARFMRQDFFEFRPQFKLFVAGNHQPVLRTVDEAIRRRFNLIPFSVTIPEAEKDRELSQKLAGEWPGILRWMIDGCLAWQRQGLDPPAAVTEATSAYLEVQDSLAAWLAECCEESPVFQDTSARLFASWKAFAERAGEQAQSQKAFAPKIEARGFTPCRSAAVRSFRGLRLKPQAPPSYWREHDA